jgi:L-lactate transport
MWYQPLNPLGFMPLSALAAAVPLAVLLVLMGGLRKSGAVSAAWGLVTSFLLALLVWKMPVKLAALTAGFGACFALWPILWIVFTALWLYNLSVATGKFDLLRRWMAQHASGNPGLQAILVAFCFGALLEGMAGFGAPVAMAAFLLLGLGFTPQKAVVVSLIANTAPVAFGSLGIPIVALAGVTGLDQMKLSAMVGRQLPFLSFILPAYIVWVVGGWRNLREVLPPALVAGASFALAQFSVSNFWGPYAADIVAALASIAAFVGYLKLRPAPLHPSGNPAAVEAGQELSVSQTLSAWTPWVVLAAVMIGWSALHILRRGEIPLAVPGLHNAVFITLYQKPYTAVYVFQPLAAGTAVVLAILITALIFGAGARTVLAAALDTLRQLRKPGLTVMMIVALAYLYNYSGMAYTLGAALASLGWVFPFFSGFLGWIACFLTGSDTASNLLFGNLQVAAGHQIGVDPVLLAATNSSGAVAGKMISPQNVAVGVTTVALVGKEGDVVRATFWHSIAMATFLSLLAFAQAYWLKWMVP